MPTPDSVAFDLPVPSSQLRTVDRGFLFAELTLSFDSTSRMFTTSWQGQDASETWMMAVTMPAGTPFDLMVPWYDTADDARLDLVTSTRCVVALDAHSTSMLTTDFDDFESDAFDADEASASNLQEGLVGPPPFGETSLALADALLASDVFSRGDPTRSSFFVACSSVIPVSVGDDDRINGDERDISFVDFGHKGRCDLHPREKRLPFP